MLIKMFKSKIHRATITGANLDYEGSIKIDQNLLDASDIKVGEAVYLWNVSNGSRLMTYTLSGERGSGVVETNGACSHLCGKGHLVIISTFADMTPEEACSHRPTVVLVDAENKIKSINRTSGGLE